MGENKIIQCKDCTFYEFPGNREHYGPPVASVTGPGYTDEESVPIFSVDFENISQTVCYVEGTPNQKQFFVELETLCEKHGAVCHIGGGVPVNPKEPGFCHCQQSFDCGFEKRPMPNDVCTRYYSPQTPTGEPEIAGCTHEEMALLLEGA